MKYENIIRSLKLQYPDHHVEQLTFIVDCLGGFSKTLVKSLRKLDLSSNTCDSILLGIQKIVLDEARHLLKGEQHKKMKMKILLAFTQLISKIIFP